MGRKKNESTLRMESEFMALHSQGMTIPQIAKKFNLTTTTIYSLLDDIAKQNGVSRESLLERVHPKHQMSSDCYREQLAAVNPIDYNTRYNEVMVGIYEIRKMLKKVIDTEITEGLS